jgi:hypothetical protein
LPFFVVQFIATARANAVKWLSPRLVVSQKIRKQPAANIRARIFRQHI